MRVARLCLETSFWEASTTSCCTRSLVATRNE